MRLLADENQHSFVVRALRAAGYEIEWVAESTPGAQDSDILARPDIADVCLITYDRDFGDLIFNRGYRAPAAILYTRLNRARPDVIASRLLTIIEAGVEAGHMTTITADGVRLKPFPVGAPDARP